MEEESYKQLLEQKGLKKTKVRIALLQHFMSIEYAQSYNDLQAVLVNEVDKSTLYRSLASFEQAGIIHSINDHSGLTKYAFGQPPSQGNEHAHFVCERCEMVYCMGKLAPLELNVPMGFKTNKVQTILKGVCSDC
jgi:Fur family ferric uptake transcriptional regulator